MTATRSNFAHKLSEFPRVALADSRAFDLRGHWREHFRAKVGGTFNGRVILEVGCADAGLISRIASRFPGTGFVGIDWKYKAIYGGARHVEQLGLQNLLLIRGRAGDLVRIFADREVDEVLLFHPEPCAVEKQLKNRLMAEPFLRDVHRLLRDERSTLSLKTDHAGYFESSLRLLGVSVSPVEPVAPSKDSKQDSGKILRAFNVVCHTANFWQDAAAQAFTADRCFAGEQSSYEARFVKRRKPIHYVQATKNPSFEESVF